jgi:hypothetical protein
MNARTPAQAMRLRRCTVERQFSLLKYVIFGNARYLMRGLAGARIETSLAMLAYNMKTMMSVMDAHRWPQSWPNSRTVRC